MNAKELATYVAENKDKVISILSSVGVLPLNERIVVRTGPVLEIPADNEEEQSPTIIHSLKFEIMIMPNVYNSQTILIENINELENFFECYKFTEAQLDSICAILA